MKNQLSATRWRHGEHLHPAMFWLMMKRQVLTKGKRYCADSCVKDGNFGHQYAGNELRHASSGRVASPKLLLYLVSSFPRDPSQALSKYIKIL